jgi:histidinol dehydrogenase
MKTYKYPSKADWQSLQRRPEKDVTTLFDTVREVLEDVRRNGDEAVRRYGERFDHVRIDRLRVTDSEFDEAENIVDETLKQAIIIASRNIEMFHEAQRFEAIEVETVEGVVCRQKAVAIEKIGLYVPGGTAPLFSSVAMLAIPARIAGCAEITLCTPPNTEGKIHPAILYAARISGVKNVFKVGGIQAIAAMAYGTESIPKSYKLFGPGNQYVTAAKQLVSLQDVAVDMPAGPSEALIMADADANPTYIAADFLSQAEHGADSQSILLTTSEVLAEAVAKEVGKQLQALPRRELTEKSLEHSRIIILHDTDEMVAFSNEYAPEHLLIQTADYRAVSERITNAGSVFLGAYTPESAGDYASGTNHTLPTKGYARMYSGVNLDSFVRKVTFQELNRKGLQTLSQTIETMAAAEQLEAHRKAVEIRL